MLKILCPEKMYKYINFAKLEDIFLTNGCAYWFVVAYDTIFVPHLMSSALFNLKKKKRKKKNKGLYAQVKAQEAHIYTGWSSRF